MIFVIEKKKCPSRDLVPETIKNLYKLSEDELANCDFENTELIYLRFCPRIPGSKASDTNNGCFMECSPGRGAFPAWKVIKRD